MIPIPNRLKFLTENNKRNNRPGGSLRAGTRFFLFLFLITFSFPSLARDDSKVFDEAIFYGNWLARETSLITRDYTLLILLSDQSFVLHGLSCYENGKTESFERRGEWVLQGFNLKLKSTTVKAENMDFRVNSSVQTYRIADFQANSKLYVTRSSTTPMVLFTRYDIPAEKIVSYLDCDRIN